MPHPNIKRVPIIWEQTLWHCVRVPIGRPEVERENLAEKGCKIRCGNEVQITDIGSLTRQNIRFGFVPRDNKVTRGTTMAPKMTIFVDLYSALIGCGATREIICVIALSSCRAQAGASRLASMSWTVECDQRSGRTGQHRTVDRQTNGDCMPRGCVVEWDSLLVSLIPLYIPNTLVFSASSLPVLDTFTTFITKHRSRSCSLRSFSFVNVFNRT